MSITGVLLRSPEVPERIAFSSTSSGAPALWEHGVRFVGVGRVDNSDELARTAGTEGGPVGAGTPSPSDDQRLMFAAYRRWGTEAARRIRGDWVFAAWHPAERRLVLARDAFGTTSLYYYADAEVVVFSSSLRTLAALELVPVEIDELFLARHLVAWNVHGEETSHRGVKRLPPSHVLTVGPDELALARSLRLEETSIQRQPERQAYADGLRQALDAAVRTHLRGVDVPAVTLSGGLDSGSVAAMSAQALRDEGRGPLLGFTSVPAESVPAETAAAGDAAVESELPFAEATARHAGNIDLRPIAERESSPVGALRRAIDLIGHPVHGAANVYWMLGLFEAAKTHGAVLLTGQQGNGGMSWTGSLVSQPISFQIRRLGSTWFRQQAARALPPPVRRTRRSRRAEWLWAIQSPIAPGFVRRLALSDRYADMIASQGESALDRRLRVLMPDRSAAGAVWAELGEAFGVEVRDPTADVDLVAYSLSIPDEAFIDRETGLDRWPLRQAMRGLLPDEVRLNRQRLRQAPDLVHRLRSHAEDVDAALAELQAGRAAEYLDLDRMRRVWASVQTEESLDTRRDAALILMRGIMAGLWANQVQPRPRCSVAEWLSAHPASLSENTD